MSNAYSLPGYDEWRLAAPSDAEPCCGHEWHTGLCGEKSCDCYVCPECGVAGECGCEG